MICVATILNTLDGIILNESNTHQAPVVTNPLKKLLKCIGRNFEVHCIVLICLPNELDKSFNISVLPLPLAPLAYTLLFMTKAVINVRWQRRTKGVVTKRIELPMYSLSYWIVVDLFVDYL